jgi:hypothetical protein
VLDRQIQEICRFLESACAMGYYESGDRRVVCEDLVDAVVLDLWIASRSACSSSGATSNESSWSRATTVTTAPSGNGSPSRTTFPPTTLPVATFIPESYPFLAPAVRQWSEVIARPESEGACLPWICWRVPVAGVGSD